MGVFECKMSKYSILISSRDLSRTHNSIRILAFGCCRNWSECFPKVLTRRFVLCLSLWRCAPISIVFTMKSQSESFGRHSGLLRRNLSFNWKRSVTLGLNTEYSIRELWFHNRQVFTIPCIRYSHWTRELWFHNRQVFTILCIRYSHSTLVSRSPSIQH